jgi:Kinesin motor domain
VLWLGTSELNAVTTYNLEANTWHTAYAYLIHNKHRLLQQSLGGNARTGLILNVPPGSDVSGETLGSLQFAQRALRVTVSAAVNVHTGALLLRTQVNNSYAYN